MYKRQAQVNADHVDELITLIEEVKPDVVLNLALPYQEDVYKRQM